ncbi:MAG: hypothetical protein U1A77_12735 [Pirellulales bacterium]
MAPAKPIKLAIEKVLEKSKAYQELFKEGLVSSGKLALYIDLKLPEEEDEDDAKSKTKSKTAKKSVSVDRRAVQMAAESRVAAIQKTIEESLEAAAKIVKESYEAKPQDFKRAKDALDKWSKYAEELLEDTPSEVRTAVQRRTKLPADDMSTINDLTFKKPTITRGRFKSDNAEVLDDAPDYSDEFKELWSSKNLEKMGQSDRDKTQKKQQIDCILFVKGDDLVLLLGFSGSPKSTDWKKYLEAKPDQELTGVIEPTKDNLTIRVDGQIANKKNLLTKAIKDQCGVTVKYDK